MTKNKSYSEKLRDSRWLKKNINKLAFEYNKWIYVSSWNFICANVPNIPAVYVIYLDDELSYIGQTNTFAHRIKQHKIEQDINNMFVTKWGILRL